MLRLYLAKRPEPLFFARILKEVHAHKTMVNRWIFFITLGLWDQTKYSTKDMHSFLGVGAELRPISDMKRNP